MQEEEASRVEALEAEIRRLQLMLKCSPDFVARITLDGSFLYVNHVAPGFELSQVLGSNVLGYIPEAFRSRAQAAIDAAQKTRCVQQYATIGPLSSNLMGHYLTRVSPVVENGAVTSLVMTATDVTALEEHRILLQLALDSMGLGTFTYNPVTGAGNWDDKARSVFGLPPGTPMPGMERFVGEYLHPADREAVTTSFERVLTGSAFGPLEYRIRLPAGTERWVSAAGTGMRDPEGRTTTIVGTLRDVTERRALEARLRSAEKLESIGRLAGGVAHDFNNMLTAILGNLSFAASVDSLEEVRPLLDEARVAAERSAALTAQLLAFARKQVIEPKVIAPDEAIRRLEGLLRRLLDEQKKLELTLSARGHVRIAESQFEQVVMNLVTNAREALAGAGSISIETRDLFIDEADGKVIGVPPGAYVTLAVSDTGRGIAPEIRPFLFEPFFTTREGGTGLGLATCYGIVKQNGGTISVDSELDRGATFRVYLPRVEADELVASVRPPAPRSAGALKVLIVEDEENVRRVLGRSLAGREFEVFIAPSAEAARKLGDQHGPFDVLLTDVMMPDVHGQELAQELRGRWPDLRVLFLSGYAQGLSLKDQPQDSTVRLLQKPFHPSELVEAVQQLVSDTKSAPRARSYDPT